MMLILLNYLEVGYNFLEYAYFIKGDIMQYYYDINLHFDDYYMNYYEWSEFEHFNRLPIFKVISVRPFLDNEIKLDLDYKNIIVSDGIVSLGLELIDKKAIYISSLPYEDELKINKLVANISDNLNYKIIKKMNNLLITNIDRMKKEYINLLDKGSSDLIKLLYYEVTGKLSNNIDKMREFLHDDICTNFREQYYQLYDMIMIGD